MGKIHTQQPIPNTLMYYALTSTFSNRPFQIFLASAVSVLLKDFAEGRRWGTVDGLSGGEFNAGRQSFERSL